MKDKIFQQQGKSTKGSEMEIGHQIMIPGETKGRGLAVVRQDKEEGLAVSVGGRRHITRQLQGENGSQFRVSMTHFQEIRTLKCETN